MWQIPCQSLIKLLQWHFIQWLYLILSSAGSFKLACWIYTFHYVYMLQEWWRHHFEIWFSDFHFSNLCFSNFAFSILISPISIFLNSIFLFKFRFWFFKFWFFKFWFFEFRFFKFCFFEFSNFAFSKIFRISRFQILILDLRSEGPVESLPLVLNFGWGQDWKFWSVFPKTLHEVRGS